MHTRYERVPFPVNSTAPHQRSSTKLRHDAPASRVRESLPRALVHESCIKTKKLPRAPSSQREGMLPSSETEAIWTGLQAEIESSAERLLEPRLEPRRCFSPVVPPRAFHAPVTGEPASTLIGVCRGRICPHPHLIPPHWSLYPGTRYHGAATENRGDPADVP